jgi:penicillin-binding protein 1C
MAEGRNSWRKRGWKLLRVLLGIAGIFIILDLCFPLRPDLPYAPLIRDRNGVVMHAFLASDEQWRFRTELSEITPELSRAILFKEDRHFYRHPGVNGFAVVRALGNNIFRMKRTSGASTITMQVARMLQPKRRSYVNKLVEMFRALQLELHYSKAEILQFYLNLVPYGSNIQGVKAASLLYFNKSPDQLSLAELTALSIIPNRPNSLVMGRDNLRIVQERNRWLQRFRAAGLFDSTLINDALHEPLSARRLQAPASAPQFAWRLRFAFPSQLDIRSSVDSRTQLMASDIVSSYVQGLKLQQVHNASVLILDNQTGEVLTYIGSPEFTDRAHNGQVDGVKALRSPGSTLKPFLYGLAYDAGYASPQTIINDVPVNLGGYCPENYDLQFRGPVSVNEALRQSLNIPAVKMLQQLTVPRFSQELGNAGFRSVWQQHKKLGMSMILGGCTVRLEELCALYSALANGGEARGLRWTPAPKGLADTNKVRVLSPSAAWMVSHTLCELARPDMPQLADAARNVPKIAWKTGTSYGRKDAWSIGYNGRYTIGVWLGNFNGRGITSLSGAATATPLLFRLFNAVDRNASAEWLRAPEDVQTRFVCRFSGMLPGDSCTEQVMDYYIPGVSNPKRCNHQREVWLSADGSFSYCTSCLPPGGYRPKIMRDISPELAAFYESKQLPYERIPPHNPSCGRVFDGQPPRITTLQHGVTYLITDRGKQGLQFGCQSASDVRTVYWYVNDRFFRSAAAGEKLLYLPESPQLKVSCTDDKGRNSDLEVKLKFL